MSIQLATRPEMHPLYNLRLLPLTIERSALLAQVEWEERYEIECAETAYDEERRRVDEEWKRGQTRLRERLVEGIEERRRRAREEKEGEGTGAGQFILRSCSSFQMMSPLQNHRRYTRLDDAPAYNPQTPQQARDLASSYSSRHGSLCTHQRRHQRAHKQSPHHDGSLPQPPLPLR